MVDGMQAKLLFVSVSVREAPQPLCTWSAHLKILVSPYLSKSMRRWMVRPVGSDALGGAAVHQMFFGPLFST
jgi:hypothetical protein